MSSRKYYYYRRPIRYPSETNMPDQRPVGDRHATLETDMPHWRPTCHIGDQHASTETDMPHWRPMRDQHAYSEIHQRPTCLIGDPSETNMPYLRPTLRKICIRHVSLRWVSDQACRSLMWQVGLQWGMSVSDGSPIRHVGLRWVYDQACWSPMRNVRLRWGMSVSNGSPIGLWK